MWARFAHIGNIFKSGNICFRIYNKDNTFNVKVKKWYLI